MTRRVFLALAATAPLLRAEPWEDHLFPDWSPQIVDQLLTDSPWAHPVAVQFEFQPSPQQTPSEYTFQLLQFPGSTWPPTGVPGIPGIGWPRRPRTEPTTRIPGTSSPGQGGRSPSVRAEAYLTVRWSSALPIRQALALERWGQDGIGTAEAVEFLGADRPDYVVEIFGLPANLAVRGTKPLEKDLDRTARLEWKGRALRTTGAEVPEYGEHLSAELHFERSEALTTGLDAITFQATCAAMEIAAKFKPKAMQYQGRLEL